MRTKRTTASKAHHYFTLIELLVVIAIIAILAAMLMPALNQAKEKGRQALCTSNFKQIAISVLSYTDDSDEYLPPFKLWSGTNSYYSFASNHDTRTFMDGDTGYKKWKNLGICYDYIGDARILYCPSQDSGDFVYGRYADPTFPTLQKFIDGTGTDYTRVGCNYNPYRNGAGGSSFYRYQRLRDVDDDMILAMDLFTEADDRFAHGNSLAWNITKGDGSVHFKRSDQAYSYAISHESQLHGQSPNENDEFLDILQGID